MKTSRLLLTAGLIAMIAGPVSAGESVTVGWFLQRIATARHLSTASPELISQELRRSGIALQNLDAASALTEGDIVGIGRAMGINLTTHAPSALASRQQAEAFVLAFVPETGSNGSIKPLDSGGVPNDASDNGKGKKKGHNKSSSEPL